MIDKCDVAAHKTLKGELVACEVCEKDNIGFYHCLVKIKDQFICMLGINKYNKFIILASDIYTTNDLVDMIEFDNDDDNFIRFKITNNKEPFKNIFRVC
ncbi:hypothetical protein KPL28_00130 [Clostridium algidicarnis]|uniref:hypothetical protein n=1 Tax=Clostridium algidicarnis TaxID=37659 RepID=UPI001C0E8EDF|nr:hypothetical protein [Clostridium algidicarnis]MBU3208038.1 hypothetical protein [Clostridium algidicarnis]